MFDRHLGSRSSILCEHPLTRVGRFPNLAGGPQALPRARPSTVATCITMHRRSPAKLPDLPRWGSVLVRLGVVLRTSGHGFCCVLSKFHRDLAPATDQPLW